MSADRCSSAPRQRSGAAAVLRRVFFALAIGAGSLVAIAGVLWAVFLRSAPAPRPPLSGRLAHGSLAHGGRMRTFLYYIPAHLEPAPALVIAFHGSMGNGAQARAGFGYDFDRLADEHGFVVAYPDAIEQHWNDCRKMSPFASRRLGIDDVGFTRALVAYFRRQSGIDEGRVFVTGISNGGQMAIRVALEAPELVHAVAPVVASLPSENNMNCRASGVPVAILFMNGTDDPMNPYDGGDVALYGVWGNRGEVLSSLQSATWFARLAGHRGAPEREILPDRNTDDGSTVERVRWSGSSRKPVVLNSVRGGGHTVPHPTARAPRLLGRTNADISAAEEIWAFFQDDHGKSEE